MKTRTSGWFIILAILFCVLWLGAFTSNAEEPPESEGSALITMRRMYNPKTMEHLYTADTNEVSVLMYKQGWDYEGISWYAPGTSSTPVYRVFNTRTGEHFYTKDAYERSVLLANTAEWSDEGIGWYSDEARGIPVYRLYNPEAGIGAHHYTKDAYERAVLLQQGWLDEGIAWYGAVKDESGLTDAQKALKEVFKQPGEFVFSVGVGAWATFITVDEDLHFFGDYHDSGIGDGYIVRDVCRFEGDFTNAARTGETSFSLHVDRVFTDRPLHEVWWEYEYGNAIECTEEAPSGISENTEYYLYLSGTDLATLPDDIAEDIAFYLRLYNQYNVIQGWCLYNTEQLAVFL